LSLIILLSLVWAAPAFGQNKTNTEALLGISRDERAAFRASALKLDSLIAANGGARIFIDSTGLHREWVGIRNGRPIMYQTHNRKAAASSGISTLHSGDIGGLALTGEGQRIGLWDSGHPRLDHIEFGGRVFQSDEFSLDTNHSTHVGGTLIAFGDWFEARGMAPSATIEAHDWTNDAAEMADAAAAGLIVSNHSYGQPLGWTPNIRGDGLWGWMGIPSISSSEDPKFGYYSEDAALWDQVAVSAPHYVIVKSAGNEREIQGPPGAEPHYIFNEGWTLSTSLRDRDGGSDGFDTIGDTGVAKNVLTVGAVEDAPWRVQHPDDVVMTDFSGWGPVDDGRIKPDLVANGTDLMSAKSASSTDYGPSSGTSMAAPVVAGAVTLLQELYAREFGGRRPLSSTIRGLLVHAADEAGTTPGPDYRFGWGHLNADRAARHVRQTAVADLSAAPVRPYDAWIVESTLSAASTFEFEVTLTESKALRATLAWTDPASEIRELALNDRTLRLTHDLDLEIVGTDGVHLPWVLDPSRPNDAAGRGINIRDNIEQVVFDAQPGTYTVRVRAPATLQTPEQTFSVILGDSVSDEAATTYALSGSVSLRGIGIRNMEIRMNGPVLRGATTLNDGVFLFDDLPAGTYEVTIEPTWFEISPERMTITLPGAPARIDFELTSPIEHERTRFFTSHLLLQSGEQGVASDVSVAEAGGVYGVEIFFNTDIASDIAGSTLLIDTRFDPFVAPFSGNEASNLLDLSALWKVEQISPTEMMKRIPVLWFSGDTPPGHVATIPYQVRDEAHDQLIFADTLKIEINGLDRSAPLPLPSFRTAGASFAAPGESMEIRAGFLDGSAITSARALLYDRFDSTSVLAEIELEDTGDLTSNLDFVRGDGIYTGRFFPTIEADYRLTLIAEDEHGNRVQQRMNAYYSSVVFDASGEVLFLADNESGSRSEAHVQALRELGVSFSWWETLTRGRISGDDLQKFDDIIVGRHGVPLQSDLDIQVLDQHLLHGGRMAILGQTPVAGALARDWLEHNSGFRLQESVRASRVRGAGPLFGLRTSLSEEAHPQELDIPTDAEPLLTSNGRVLAAQRNQIILSSISAASTEILDERKALLGGLLFAQTGDASFIDPPAPLVIHTSDTTLAYSDFMGVSWDEQTFAYLEFQISNDSTFAANVNTLITDVSPLEIGPLERQQTFFWRARAVNPAATGVWSRARTLTSRPLNRPPVAVANTIVLDTGTGKQPSIFDLSAIFSDPDADEMRFDLTVSPVGIVETIITGDKLEILPLAAGNAVVTLSATDPFNLTERVDINVSVGENTAPFAIDWPRDPFHMIPEDSQSWALEELFGDVDGDSLHYWVFNADSTVAVVTITETEMIISSFSNGDGFIAVNANDARGSDFTQSLTVRVKENAPPESDAPDIDPELLVGERGSFRISDFFSDPDEDLLLYDLISVPENAEDVMIAGDTLSATFNRDGTAVFSIEASDPFGESVISTVSVAVRSHAVVRNLDDALPLRFTVNKSYPQPFSSRVTIPFAIPSSVQVTLEIFDSLGRRQATILNRIIPAGFHQIDWVPQSLPAGNYYFRLHAGANTGHGILIYTR